MKSPEQLLRAFTAAFREPRTAAELFADDGAFELPYLASLGINARYRGREEIAGFLHTVLELYPDWEFKAQDLTILISTPDQVFAEYITRPTAAATGRTIEHLFMGRLVAVNGQITLLREALNTVAAAQVLLPAGAAEIPAPSGLIRSF